MWDENEKLTPIGKLLIILLSPIWIPIAILFIIAAVISLLTIVLPIYRKMQLTPGYWFTWKEVKLLTGASTNRVLFTLGDNGWFEFRPRSGRDLERLGRHYRYPYPRSGRPLLSHTVVFFEFRPKRSGGRRRPTLREILASAVSKPLLAPARA